MYIEKSISKYKSVGMELKKLLHAATQVAQSVDSSGFYRVAVL